LVFFNFCLRLKGAGIEFSSFQLERPSKKIHIDDKVTSDETVHDVLEDNRDREEEVIASHGSCHEHQELNDWCSRNNNSRPNTAEVSAVMCCAKDVSAESLQQKVRNYVMEQLFSHVWLEVSQSLEPLLQRPNNAALLQGQRRLNTCTSTLGGTVIPFIPVADVRDSERFAILSASAKSLQHSAGRTGLETDDLGMSQLARTRASVDPIEQLRESPIVSLPKPLSLHSANRLLASTATLESRGYHSAADRRTYPMLNRRLSSMTSGHERLLRPLEEQQKKAAKATATSRQVSAPASPPSWSRHVMLPPIDRLDPQLKVVLEWSLFI
jgi:hypothetical protein